MRLVVDTNVLISGIHWGGIPAGIIHGWIENKFTVVCTAEIIDEYSEVVRRMNPGLAIS